MSEGKALPVLIREFCGIAGEDFKGFKEQYDKLTEADRQWFRAEFERMGVAVK